MLTSVTFDPTLCPQMLLAGAAAAGESEPRPGVLPLLRHPHRARHHPLLQGPAAVHLRALRQGDHQDNEGDDEDDPIDDAPG